MSHNCWEHKACGREPGGIHTRRKGICPSATHLVSHGVNDGKNAGRYCWSVAGTFAEEVHCECAEHEPTCMTCVHFKKVKIEEGAAFIIRH